MKPTLPDRDPLSARGIRDVKLGGAMGRRIDIKVNNATAPSRI